MLHGREPELADLRARLAGAREGRSFALVLAGEAGIGKTALLQQVVDEADGFRVLLARGFESEAEIPYAGLLGVARPLLALADALPEQQQAALRSALALGPPTAHDRFAVPVALLALLGLAAQEQPLLLAVDDAQWLDAATREALLFAARRLRDERVGVLLTVRHADAAPPVAFAGLEVVELGGLDAAGARALIGQDVAATVADALAAATGGNPLALLELPAVLTEDERRGLRPIAQPLPAGERVEQLFSARVAALPQRTRRALGVAAAVEDGALDPLFGALPPLGLRPDDLGPAEQAGVVTVRGTRLQFRHPLVRSAAYQAQTVVERHSAHAALAAATEDVRVVAWHRAQAATAPDEDVAGTLAAAGHDATERGAPAAAAATLARAAELTPDPQTAAVRRLDAAAAAHEAGDDERAVALLGAAEGHLPPGERPRHRRLRALVAMRGGDAPTGILILEREAARLAAEDPLAAAEALLLSAPAYMHSGDMPELLEVAHRAAALAGSGASPVATMAANLIPLGHSAMGSAHEHLDAMERSGADLEGGGAPEVSMACAEGLYLHERYDDAARLIERHVARARREGAVLHLLYALTIRAHLRWRLGDWRAARADLEEATGLHDAVAHDTIYATYVHANGALLAMDSGALEEGRRLADAAYEVASRHSGVTLLAHALWVRGRQALLEGDAARAADELRPVAAGRDRPAWGNLMFALAEADLGEALVRLGRTEEARALAEELRRRAARQQVGLLAAHAARIEGLAAADDAFEAPFAEALAVHAELPLPFEHARTLLALGGRRRRLRQDADARRPLQEALATFERLGAEAWAAQAREEIRLSGARGGGAAAGAEGVAALTDHERRVAELVAQGLTNREVGAQLYLSPKTIEHHLSAVYRKLGVRSRTQLARALGDTLRT